MVTGPVYQQIPGDLTDEQLHYRRPPWAAGIDWDQFVAPWLTRVIRLFRGF